MIKTIRIKLNEADLDVTGYYTEETPDVWYLRNGDPGYPGEAASFEIDKVEYNGQDITPVIEALNGIHCSLVRKNDRYPYDDIWTSIEQECLKLIN